MMSNPHTLSRPLSRQLSPLIAGFISLTALLPALVACSGGGGQKANSAQPPRKEIVPITIGMVDKRSVPLLLTAIGTVEPYATINVKSQVNGLLTRVHFTEGQEVKTGDVLFTIDTRPYQTALAKAQSELAKAMAMKRQAEATVTKDATQARNAHVTVARLEKLVQRGAASRDIYDQARTNAEAFDATVLADQAAVQNAAEAIRGAQVGIESAKIDLSYCTIRSPISGRTGDLMANQGNLIKANADTSLVVINQLRPIYTIFSVPEQYLPQIKRYMAQRTLPVKAAIPQDAEESAVGELSFLDNQVDRATGTIKLKGTFKNEDRRLWPGQFVNISLTLAVQADTILAPLAAIQTGQNGSYVYVVKPDLTVESRPVTQGDNQGDEVVITQGLKPGEKVVTDGQLRLIPGAQVEIKNAPTGIKPNKGQVPKV